MEVVVPAAPLRAFPSSRPAFVPLQLHPKLQGETYALLGRVALATRPEVFLKELNAVVAKIRQLLVPRVSGPVARLF